MRKIITIYYCDRCRKEIDKDVEIPDVSLKDITIANRSYINHIEERTSCKQCSQEFIDWFYSSNKQ